MGANSSINRLLNALAHKNNWPEGEEEEPKPRRSRAREQVLSGRSVVARDSREILRVGNNCKWCWSASQPALDDSCRLKCVNVVVVVHNSIVMDRQNHKTKSIPCLLIVIVCSPLRSFGSPSLALVLACWHKTLVSESPILLGHANFWLMLVRNRESTRWPAGRPSPANSRA